MSTNSYGVGVLPSDDFSVILKCLIAVGYTNTSMGNDLDGTLHCHVNEIVDSATMKTAIEAVYPPPGTLSHNAADPLVIAGDGVATALVTITDPRGASAEGKIVKLVIPEGVFIPVSGDSFTLDLAGEAVVTFGPLSGCLGDTPMTFYYENGEADAASFILRFGSA